MTTVDLGYDYARGSRVDLNRGVRVAWGSGNKTPGPDGPDVFKPNDE